MERKGPLAQTPTPKSKVQRTTPWKGHQPSNTFSHQICSRAFVPGQIQYLTRHWGASHRNIHRKSSEFHGNNRGNLSGTFSRSQNHEDTFNGSVHSWNHVQGLDPIVLRTENTQQHCDRSFNLSHQDTNVRISPLNPRQGVSCYTLTQPIDYHSETRHQYHRKTCSSDAGHKYPNLCSRNQGNEHGFSANDVASSQIDSFSSQIPRKLAHSSNAEKNNNHFHGNHSTDSRENVDGNLSNSVHRVNVTNRDSLKYSDDSDMYTEGDGAVKCSDSERDVLVNELRDEPNFSISQLEFNDDTIMDPDQVELSRQILRIAKVQKRLLDINVELDSLNKEDRRTTVGDSKLEWDVSKISDLADYRGVEDISVCGRKELSDKSDMSEECLKVGDASPRSYMYIPETGNSNSPVKERVNLVRFEEDSLHKDLESSTSHVQSGFAEQTETFKVLTENGCDSVCASPKTFRTESFGCNDSTQIDSEGNSVYRMSPKYLESKVVSGVAPGAHCQSCTCSASVKEVDQVLQPVPVSFSDPGIRGFNKEDQKIQLHQTPLNTCKDFAAISVSTSPCDGSTSRRNLRDRKIDTSKTVSSQIGANLIIAKQQDSSRQRHSSFVFSPPRVSSASVIKNLLPDNKSDAATQSHPQCSAGTDADMVYMSNEAYSPQGGAYLSLPKTLQTGTNNLYLDSQTQHTSRNILLSPRDGASPPMFRVSSSESAALTKGGNFSANRFCKKSCLTTFSEKKSQTNVPEIVPKFVRENTEENIGTCRRQLQACLETYGSDALKKTFLPKDVEFVPISTKPIPPHSGLLTKTTQRRRRKLAYSHDSRLANDSDVESLLNRSQELQNQLRLSTEETDEFHSLSPTYLPPSLLFCPSSRIASTPGFVSQSDLSSSDSSHQLNCRVHTSRHQSSAIQASPLVTSEVKASPNLTCWSPMATCLTSPDQTKGASSAQGTLDLDNSPNSWHALSTSPLAASPISAQEWNARITHLMKSYGSLSQSKSLGYSPGCDVCSSGTRTIKLIELLYGSDRDKLQEFVLKARWFTKWRANIKRKTAWRKSIKVCIERADIFWRRILITRYFYQWQGLCRWKERLAVSVCERRALQKGLNGLKWAVQQSKDVEDAVVQTVKTLELRCAFNKWRNQTAAKRLNRLQRMFTRWRLNVVKKRRMRLLTAKATSHLLSKMYYQWKLAMYQTQSSGIADLHYKVTVLYKFFDTWRQIANTAVSERYEMKTASLHYERNLRRTTFNQMKFTYTLHCVAKSHHRKKTLLAAVCSWHQATRLAKMERLQQLSMARELRRHHVLKATLSHWYRELMGRRAEHHYEKGMLRNAFTTWQKTMKVHCEHDMLQAAIADRFFLKRALDQWHDKVTIQKDVQRKGALVLQRVWLKILFSEWKYYASYQAELRNKVQIVRTWIDTRTTKTMLDVWRRRFYSQLEQVKAKEVWSHACVRRALQQWRRLVHVRKLDRLLAVSDSRRNQHDLVVYFSKWQAAQLRIRQLNERGVNVGGILSRSRLHHYFMTWRIRVKESELISPLRHRVRRKTMTRAFDAWRNIVVRKKMVSDIQAHHDQRQLRRAFKIWRNAHQDVQQFIRARGKILLGVERRVLHGLREVVQMKMKGKVYNQERLLRQALLTWRTRFQEREERLAEIHEMAKHRFLETSWKRWRQALIREKRSQIFLELDNKMIVKETFNAWKQLVLHRKDDKALKSYTDSEMVLDDPDTLSEVDVTQSSHRSSGFFSESDSELHAV